MRWRVGQERRGSLWLGGVWREVNRLDPDEKVIDEKSYLVRAGLYVACMNALLEQAQVDRAMIWPSVVDEVKYAQGSRALFGLAVTARAFGGWMIEPNLPRVENYILQNPEKAKEIFAGFAFEEQELFGDATNFAEYVVMTNLLNQTIDFD